MAAQMVLRDLRAGAPSITYETGGAGGGRLMRNIAITRTTRTTTTRIVMVVITASYSSPFAPAQLTSAATGGRKVALIPATAASATAPHRDAVTPARW